MPFQPCPNTAEIRIQGVLHGQTVENVMHCRVSASPTQADLDTIRDTVNDWVLGVYSAHLSNMLGWVQIIVTDLNTASGLQSVQSLAGDSATVDGDVKTNQDTFAVKLLTGHRGRSFRGRVYVLAVPSGYYDTANTLNPLNSAAYVNLFNSLKTDLAAVSFPLGVLSRYSGVDSSHKPIPRAAGLLTDVTSVASTDNIVDSQNRRLPGRGI